MELGRFVEEGGTLITEGSTAALMAEFNLNSGITVEHPSQLFARGSILRGTFTDSRVPSRMAISTRICLSISIRTRCCTWVLRQRRMDRRREVLLPART